MHADEPEADPAVATQPDTNALRFHPSLMEIVALMVDGARQYQAKAAVLLIDVQQIRKISDLLGTAIGERLEQSAKLALLSCVRREDAIIRNGDGEFAILVNRVKPGDDIALVAKRILESLTAAHRIDKYELRFSSRIGTATFPDDGGTAEMLLSKARVAMETASIDGHGSHRFHWPFSHARAGFKILERGRALRSENLVGGSLV